MMDNENPSGENEALERMAETGEIELENPEEEVEEKESDDVEGNSEESRYDIDGQSYSKEEILQAIEDSKNKKAWQGENTRRSQELKRQEEEYKSQFSDWSEKVKGDPLLEEAGKGLTDIDRRLAELEKREKEISQRESDERTLALMLEDTNKELGTKLDRNSPEIREFLNDMQNGNHLKMWMKSRSNAELPKNLKTATDSRSPKQEKYSPSQKAEINRIAERMGVKVSI